MFTNWRIAFGKRYDIEIGFENENLKDVKVAYADGDNRELVKLVKLEKTGNTYKGFIEPTGEKIDLIIQAEIDSATSVWTIKPMALRAIPTNIFNLGVYQNNDYLVNLAEGDTYRNENLEIKVLSIDYDNYIIIFEINGVRKTVSFDFEHNIFGDYVLQTWLDGHVLVFNIYSPYDPSRSDVGDTYILGFLKDSNSNAIKFALVEVYLDDKLIKKEVTGYGILPKSYKFDQELELYAGDGLFIHKIENNLQVAKVKARYNGAGIYLPSEKEIIL